MCGTSHSRMDNIDISSNNKFIAISENKEDGRSKFLDFLDNNEGSSVKDLNHKIFDDGYQFYNMNSNRDERGDPIYKEKYRPLENYFEIQFIEKNIEVFKEDFGLSGKYSGTINCATGLKNPKNLIFCEIFDESILGELEDLRRL